MRSAIDIRPLMRVNGLSGTPARQAIARITRESKPAVRPSQSSRCSAASRRSAVARLVSTSARVSSNGRVRSIAGVSGRGRTRPLSGTSTWLASRRRISAKRERGGANQEIPFS